MRVAIVGTGFMGAVHAEAWRQTPARVVAFVAKAADDAAARLAARCTARLALRLDDILPDVDVVDICTPTDLHPDFALRAAAAGKHVICEKPLALTVEDGQRMIQACHAHGVQLLVGHVVRFFPEYRLAHDLVVRGEIGRPAVMRFSRCVFQPRKADNWFVDPARSGGMILDLMVHDFDCARWMAGDVARVFAKSIRTRFSNAGADHALVVLTHRSGTISHVEGSWAFPPPTFRTRFEFAGSDGLVAFDGPGSTAIEIHAHRPEGAERAEVPLPRSPLHEDPYTTQLRAFFDTLVHGTPPPVTAEDGLAAVQIARAAVESARRSASVEIPPTGTP